MQLSNDAHAKLTEELRDNLKQITKGPIQVTIAARSNPRAEVSPDVLDDFMAAHDYERLGKSWIELSRKSGIEHLSKILRNEQVEWFDYASPKEIPSGIANKFIAHFNASARFFCNGLINFLEEYPPLEIREIPPPSLDSDEIRVVGVRGGEPVRLSYPFWPELNQRLGQYSAFSKLKRDMLEDGAPFGLVAVDPSAIGFMLISKFD